MLLAAQSMAVGTVMVPWVSRFADPVMATGYHLLLGGLPLLALSACTEAGLLSERLPQLTGASSCQHLGCAALATHVSVRLPHVRTPVKLSSQSLQPFRCQGKAFCAPCHYLAPSTFAMGKGVAVLP